MVLKKHVKLLNTINAKRYTFFLPHTPANPPLRLHPPASACIRLHSPAFPCILERFRRNLMMQPPSIRLPLGRLWLGKASLFFYAQGFPCTDILGEDLCCGNTRGFSPLWKDLGASITFLFMHLVQDFPKGGSVHKNPMTFLF
jgi:hypothetical protein